MVKKIVIGFGATIGTLFALFMVLVILIAAGVISGDSEAGGTAPVAPTPTLAPIPTPTPIPEILASDLHEEYNLNPIAGDLKYKGQTVIVRGRVTRISGDFLRSVGVDGNSTFQNVSCEFDKEYLPNLTHLRIGQEVAFKGVINSRGVFDTIMLKHCTLVES